MSLACQARFPSVSPHTVVVGAGYAQLSTYIIQRPSFVALNNKAKQTNDAKATLESDESKTAAASLATSLVSSSVQSYALTALLQLANVVSYKGAAVVGTLVLATQSGPKIINDILVKKEPIDVVLSGVAVKVLDTVGLALFLQWYTHRSVVPKIGSN